MNFKEKIVKNWTRKELAEQLFYTEKERVKLLKQYYGLLEKFLEAVDENNYEFQLKEGEQVKDEKNNIFVVKSINNKNGTITLKKVKSNKGRKNGNTG